MDHDMTWKQFKDAVEAQGVKDELRVSFIDTSGDREPKVKILTGGSLFRITSGDSRDPADKDDETWSVTGTIVST